MGNTDYITFVISVNSVHPHTRGEYISFRLIIIRVSGSPPHPWGIRIPNAEIQPWSRFTPTPVGNTLYDSASDVLLYGSPPHPWGIRTLKFCQPNTPAVHPHTRGEYSMEITLQSHNYGSPPHPWGILAALLQGIPSPRFTPTPVGNTD